ncbi:MAG TPA: malate dehydrogenase [Chitinophagaceae bacterium]|nr:malate dehydrogenase [Chitinophagaceae bacterium]
MNLVFLDSWVRSTFPIPLYLCRAKYFLHSKYLLFMKVTVVGAGAVGATCADNIARKELCEELVLLDIKEGIAEGKAQDMMQTATLLGFDTRITGSTNDYSKTAGSDVVVITSGLPRKPGMTREELIGVNAGIVKGVCENILKHSPNAIIIVISNPMDTMTYLALESTGLPKNRIIGMGGTLDSSRFKYQLSQHLGCSPSDLNAVVIGGHGDTTMIPLIRMATWNSVPVTKFLNPEQQQQIIKDTMVGGATLTALIGTSAWYAPGAAGAALVEAILRDEKKLFTCCVALDGEYGQKDICLGVPVIIGRNGWEKILDFELNEAEQATFNKSADAVRSMNDVLKTL